PPSPGSSRCSSRRACRSRKRWRPPPTPPTIRRSSVRSPASGPACARVDHSRMRSATPRAPFPRPIASSGARAGPPAASLTASAAAVATALGAWAAFLERSAALRARLRAALTYPAVMALAVVGVLLFLLAWVLPQMASLFAETGAPLPFPTRVLLAGGTLVARTWWAWLLVALGAALGLRAWLATPRGRARVDGLVLGLPLIRRVATAARPARVAHTP